MRRREFIMRAGGAAGAAARPRMHNKQRFGEKREAEAQN